MDDCVRQTFIGLRDLAPGNHTEIHCLVSAVREGVVADLQSTSGAVPIDVVLTRLTERLEERTAMNPEAADWTVRSVALALGLRGSGAGTSASRSGARSSEGRPRGAADHSVHTRDRAAQPQTKPGAQRHADGEQTRPTSRSAPSMSGAAVTSAADEDGRSYRPAHRRLRWILLITAIVILVGILTAAATVPTIRSRRDQAKESAVKEGIHSIQIGAQSYAVDHNDTYPDPSLVNEPGMRGDEYQYVDLWPTNPYTGAPMTQGTGPGDFTYTVAFDGLSFTLVGNGKDGEAVMTAP